MRRWVCSNEGYQRELLEKATEKRSHPLMRTGSELQFLRFIHVVSDGLVAQVRSMNKVAIKTTNIMAHVALQSGGFKRFPCQLRDVYNRVAGAQREEKIETNSQGVLGFLDCLSEKDHNFLVADGTSHMDYVAFGDVLGFDTTYMTNEYNKPFTIMVGVNHHFHTCIFGFALLLHDKPVSYSWLLRVFLEFHRQKKPRVVMTNQDPTMKQAIEEE
ncbi:protein FAR-RED IMPAIRED RESPONSE 1-like [Humulus lupulus]|uniref:protein FAR-RED IMPAIRED RESPONSE 1-like n=1 Tax=Humulus lupulus TaxID=3486 RepID=UPI002B40B267|nr:protein FAR-RED IMPAIRED RESPONSE 1-like [Humulus lupulus]